jgi:hypothetical protein
VKKSFGGLDAGGFTRNVLRFETLLTDTSLRTHFKMSQTVEDQSLIRSAKIAQILVDLTKLLVDEEFFIMAFQDIRIRTADMQRHATFQKRLEEAGTPGFFGISLLSSGLPFSFFVSLSPALRQCSLISDIKIL